MSLSVAIVRELFTKRETGGLHVHLHGRNPPLPKMSRATTPDSSSLLPAETSDPTK